MSIGGGKSSGKQSDPTGEKLAGIAEHLVRQSDPARQTLFDTMQEVMQTGGAKVPIVATSMENSRMAGSSALRQVEEGLARTGQTGTPFGQNIIANQVMQSEKGVADTKNAIAQQLFGLAPNLVLGQGSQGIQGLSGATGTNVSAKGKGMGAGAKKGG